MIEFSVRLLFISVAVRGTYSFSRRPHILNQRGRATTQTLGLTRVAGSLTLSLPVRACVWFVVVRHECARIPGTQG